MSNDIYHRNSNKTEEMKRKLEWELGRIEFILEGLRKNKQKVFEKLQSFNENQKGAVLEILVLTLLIAIVVFLYQKLQI